MWNTWGPIASSVQAAYNWSDSTVAMIANWGTIVFVISALPTSWLIETKGLRPACILLSGFVMVGTGLRCFRFLQPDPSFFLVVSHITGILNGFTGVVVMAAPAHLSCLWFPQNERTTATSIAQAANLLGNGLSMLMGPAIVSEPDSLGTSDEDIERIRKEIDIYMFVNAGIATYIFISFCIYFPSKPPQAPTLTSGLARTDFLGGIKSLVKMKDILLITFAYSLSQGIMGVWMGVMVLNFRDLNISDKQVGYIGLASTVGQCIASVVISRFTDFFRHQMKKTLILLLMGSGSMYLLLALMNFQAGVHISPKILYPPPHFHNDNLHQSPLLFSLFFLSFLPFPFLFPTKLLRLYLPPWKIYSPASRFCPPPSSGCV